MMELEQARQFYNSLAKEEQEELWDMLAEDIFFLDEALQQRILVLFEEVHLQLAAEIRRRNSFTSG